MALAKGAASGETLIALQLLKRRFGNLKRRSSNEDANVSFGTAATAANTIPDDQLQTWKAEFARTGQAIEADFRQLAPFRSGTDRGSHLLHPYPAKLLLNFRG